MSGKYRNWHRAWRRHSASVLVHESGLQVSLGPTSSTAQAVESSIPAWSEFEKSRGVPSHDLQARLARLMKEATQWQDKNQ